MANRTGTKLTMTKGKSLTDSAAPALSSVCPEKDAQRKVISKGSYDYKVGEDGRVIEGMDEVSECETENANGWHTVGRNRRGGQGKPGMSSDGVSRAEAAQGTSEPGAAQRICMPEAAQRARAPRATPRAGAAGAAQRASVEGAVQPAQAAGGRGAAGAKTERPAERSASLRPGAERSAGPEKGKAAARGGASSAAGRAKAEGLMAERAAGRETLTGSAGTSRAGAEIGTRDEAPGAASAAGTGRGNVIGGAKEAGTGKAALGAKETRSAETGARAAEPGETQSQQASYEKELTVVLELQGAESVSAMELMRAVRGLCGGLIACRSTGPRTYEVTMTHVKGKERILDGFKVGETVVHAKELCNDELMVSFLNLPAYITDAEILAKLDSWGVGAVSPIRRRMWPGTKIADGTRFLKVKFNDKVQSLPYSARFETALGPEFFRVIHDRQVKVCRMCLQPGHILRDCPEFSCHKCGVQGHYARECGSKRGARRTDVRCATTPCLSVLVKRVRKRRR